jgi:hypothetical protein
MMTRIMPLVLIIIAGCIGYFYIYPTFTGEITNDQQQIQSYDSALAAAAAFTQKENQLVGEENAIDPASLSRLEEYMPDGVDNIQLIVDMDALAAKYGISLSQFSIQNNSSSGSASSTTNSITGATVTSSVPTSGAATLPSNSSTDSLDLSVNATGTYAQFTAFLTAAEQSLRPLDITKIVLTSSGTGVYTYAITFRIYWLP